MKYADERRAKIYEAERKAAVLGVLPDDPAIRKAVILRTEKRLQRAGLGWDLNALGTVTRVDDQGIARIIPQEQGVGPDQVAGALGGGKVDPDLGKKVMFHVDQSRLRKRSTWEAAAAFAARLHEAYEKHGQIPQALAEDLQAQSWKLGQPLSYKQVRDWAGKYLAERDRRNGVRK